MRGWETAFNGPLIRYVKLRIAHAPGMPGRFSPPPTSKETTIQRSRHASRYGRYARAVMHVGIAKPRWWEKRSRHSRSMRNPQFYVSVKRPIGRCCRMCKRPIWILWWGGTSTRLNAGRFAMYHGFTWPVDISTVFQRRLTVPLHGSKQRTNCLQGDCLTSDGEGISSFSSRIHLKQQLHRCPLVWRLKRGWRSTSPYLGLATHTHTHTTHTHVCVCVVRVKLMIDSNGLLPVSLYWILFIIDSLSRKCKSKICVSKAGV